MNTNLRKEIGGCFGYFYDNFNRSKQSFGLMHDKYPDGRNICSVAANGFMLAAMAVGADLGIISRSHAKTICDKTLTTLLRLDSDRGFFYHFYHIESKKRAYRCELSLIDTALLVAGALTAAGFFGGKVEQKAMRLYRRIDWQYFYDASKKQFYMARYDNGFTGYWDYYAEQLLVYFLAAGADWGNAEEAYYSFGRLTSEFGGKPYVYGWFGSLFVHQFSHAFVDLRDKTDKNGTDWFQNSVIASLANYEFCRNEGVHKGYSDVSWGLTSCATQGGYTGHIGVPPSGNGNVEHIAEGTVAPAGAIGSIVFTPKQSLAALDYYYTLPRLVGDYGLKDSFNLDNDWYCDHYISIDKGISLVMMANYVNQTVWKATNNVAELRSAFAKLGFSQKGE